MSLIWQRFAESGGLVEAATLSARQPSGLKGRIIWLMHSLAGPHCRSVKYRELEEMSTMGPLQRFATGSNRPYGL
jgi:hypothetical protein